MRVGLSARRWAGESGSGTSPKFCLGSTSRSSAARACSVCCVTWRRPKERNPRMDQATRIAEALQSRRNVLILNHVSPDGDSLGSTLALARALWARGQRAVVGSAEGVPEMYRFLPGSDR